MSKQLGFLIDMSLCYGCTTCVMACKSEKNLPAGVLWRRVQTFEQEKPPAVAWLSVSCHHCDNPACLSVCPVKAYEKRDNGAVVQNHDKCIGCQACVRACPYGAPVFDPKTEKVSKCDLCVERLAEGLQPRCVAACPAGALKVGDISELRQKNKSLRPVIDRYHFPADSKTGPNVVVVMPK